MKKLKNLAVINCILSGVLVLLSLLTLTFNLLGEWVPWNLAGYGFYFYFLVPILFGVYAFMESLTWHEPAARRKYMIYSIVVMIVDLLFAILTLTVFCSWFW
jgi:hypothetical protein